MFGLYLQDVGVGQEQRQPSGAAGCRCRFGEVSVEEGAAATALKLSTGFGGV